MLSTIKGGLIVSCQALPEEPLHGGDTMAKMAKAAVEGGAVAIRANGAADIREMRKVTNAPIIGLVKRDYADSAVYITATKAEVEELLAVGVEMIAIDATDRARPGGEMLADLVSFIHDHDTLVLADVSTVAEGVAAAKLGCDAISTTLSGYTSYTDSSQAGPDRELLRALSNEIEVPIIAEGRVRTPEEAVDMLKLGAYAVVVGSAITRPQQITKGFVNLIAKERETWERHKLKSR
ncbi:N-acetylmannosamine-6-phosphate 2-epimerase [Paenalkalicoccus suaedae]|uniref:Putative N-acetylmannosamine-6-phosphate 2-epimerase n=2 Tax=Paenalkalicoccus suaedae TaxID=2592382 RepID=A0A859FKM0_9BACI|nr:N-acetylmannosamine-6-phosphate 2-epimerase [Paenalkalicoccus suaedae]